MKKRVLIITYYWPPSGGSGVQRWLKFAKYLPEFGWEPVIFTPENPDFDIQDPSLEKEISPDLEVIKFPIWEPYGVLGKLRGKKKTHPARILEQKEMSLLEKAAVWIRANFMVPDPRVFWVKPSVKFLLDLLKSSQFDAIITTGPPHSMHLIGKALKEKTGIYWIADFRDPWSEWEFLDTLPMTSSVRKKHQRLEQEVLEKADRVMTISPTFQRDLSKIGNRKIDLITNGFDPDDIPEGFQAKKRSAEEFHIVYTGVIDSIRNPIPFLEALKAEFEKSSNNILLTFVGKVSEQVRDFVAKDTWLSKAVDFPGYVTHQEVFGFYAKADLLLLILTDTKNAQGNIPGKLFEYMSTGVPVLALGDPNGDSAQILKESGAGQVLSYGDGDQIRAVLRKWVNKEAFNQPSAQISQFSRKAICEHLAQILDADSIS
ncbi:glycosyltransferase family 4 protein [Algoriphagus limi]|uniref:Glycosyltransferase family 4 protein n=1 Tax=Algoriphagus limi TaxID=2975273 RepID=A0ABT2G7V1_9BACT|nr:glycosyltransferase family 4 protein [Algoriphagus limi]MCS5490090.1 glycosyltransferase family 4 protein [Algoriphagus limi]